MRGYVRSILAIKFFYFSIVIALEEFFFFPTATDQFIFNAFIVKLGISDSFRMLVLFLMPYIHSNAAQW